MDDPSFTRQAEALGQALREVEKTTSSIRRSATKLITVKDIAKERQRVRSLIDDSTNHAVPAVQDCCKFFDRYLKLHPHHAASLKLLGDAKCALGAYQNASDQFYQRCCDVERKVVKKAKKNLESDEEPEELSEGAPFIDKNTTAVTVRESFEKSLYDEIMDERNREVREIAESVRDINEIFTHIHELVGEQSAKLDVVEEQVGKSELATRNAADQLRKAREAQDRSRRNQVILLIIAVVVVGIIVAVLVA